MGIFEKIFKKCTKAADNYEREDVYKVKNDNKKDLLEIEDGFVDGATFHRYWVHFENNNNKINRRSQEQASHNPRAYPITPKFMVYQYVKPSEFGDSQKLLKKTEEVQTVELEEVYPQFLRSCMKIEDTDIIAGLSKEKTKFKKLKLLLRCKSREKAHVFSSEFRVDGFTTLHSLQGDTESDTGVPDPIRKLRHRRAGCY